MNVIKINESHDGDKFLRHVASSIIWEMLYYEQQLEKAYEKLALIKAAAKRVLDGIDVDAISSDDQIDSENQNNFEDVITDLVAGACSSVEYDEAGLRRAHTQLAGLKAFLIRYNVKGIDLDQIKIHEAGKLKNNMGKYDKDDIYR